MSFEERTFDKIGSDQAKQRLGRVLSCRGSEARIGLTRLPSLGADRATIGKFVAIRCGESLSVGMISEVTDAASEGSSALSYRAVARVDLMGEIVRAQGTDAWFRRGVRNYPAIGDGAEIISRSDLNLIYSPADKTFAVDWPSATGFLDPRQRRCGGFADQTLCGFGIDRCRQIQRRCGIPIAKSTYLNYKHGGDRPILARKGHKTGGLTADTPSPYLIQDLLSLIDDRMGKLENRSTRMIHNRLMMRIEGIKNDPRYAFMFENANVGGDIMAAVLNQLFHLESEERGVTILKLASLPGETVDAIVCLTARLAFEFGLWSDGGIPLLLVCEEAHRYASADHSLGFAPARRALSRIAKEGRKYGVHLGLVTQRPAELDPTIISQCSTLFFMRMANDRDQLIVRSAVSDATENLLSFIPSFGTGEVVGIGEGMPLPARFSFKTLPKELLPWSEPGSGDSDGTIDLGRGELVKRAVERWRRATTNQSSWHADDASVDAERPPDSQNALARGLQALAAEREQPRMLDPERYTLLKR